MHPGLWLAVLAALMASPQWIAEKNETPTHIELSLEAPLVVQEGHDFEIRARVRNTAPETQTLVDLDFPEAYLKGVAIQATQPGFSSGTAHPKDELYSYTFNLPIEPGAELEILLHAYAVAPGDYSGELDFCINSETTFLSYPIRTIIK